MLASGGDDGSVIVWEPVQDSYKVKGILRSHGEIYDLAWSPCGSRIATVGIHGQVRIFDVDRLELVSTLHHHQHFVQGIAWDPLGDYLCSSSSDRSSIVYKQQKNVYKFHCINTKQNGSRLYLDETMNSFFRRSTFSPDGALFISVGGILNQDYCAHVYHRTLFHNGPFLSLVGHKKPIVCACFHPLLFQGIHGTKWIYVLASMDTITVYDTDTVMPIASVGDIHYACITDVAWSHDGLLLMVSCMDGFCSMIEFEEGELGTVVPTGLVSMVHGGMF
jgi:chromatin assembly factor 1 subunit B